MAALTAPTKPAGPGAGSAAPVTLRGWAARILMLAMGVDLGAVLAVGVARLPLDLTVPGGLATWSGRMAGLLAEVLVLGMVLLVARVPWLEGAVGQHRLVRWHRWLAPTALVAIIAHPVLLALGSAGQVRSWWTSVMLLGSTSLDAVTGTALFVLAAVASIRVVRRRLPYEGWHLLHLTTYAAVIVAFGHQLSAGSAVLQGSLVRGWWTAQLVVVLALAIVYRVALPLLRSTRHGIRVQSVERHGRDVVTVTMQGRNLERLRARGGQFLVWRFLDSRHRWRAHPFSLSAVPTNHTLRFSAREVGDGTRALSGLRPGTRVLVEGPYGVLTAGVRSGDKVLLIGAGLGIAPIRALLEDLADHVDAVVIDRESTPDEAALHHELQAIAAARANTRLHLVTGPRGPSGHPDSPLSDRQLRDFVPDIEERDVYMCGPPGLTTQLLAVLRNLGVPRARIHTESFDL